MATPLIGIWISGCVSGIGLVVVVWAVIMLMIDYGEPNPTQERKRTWIPKPPKQPLCR